MKALEYADKYAPRMVDGESVMSAMADIAQELFDEGKEIAIARRMSCRDGIPYRVVTELADKSSAIARRINERISAYKINEKWFIMLEPVQKALKSRNAMDRLSRMKVENRITLEAMHKIREDIGMP